MSKTESFAPELKALSVTLKALGSLDAVKRQYVFDAVVQRLGLSAPRGPGDGRSGASASSISSGAGATDVLRANVALTAKAFLREKRPSTDVQKIACLAFYL